MVRSFSKKRKITTTRATRKIKKGPEKLHQPFPRPFDKSLRISVVATVVASVIRGTWIATIRHVSRTQKRCIGISAKLLTVQHVCFLEGSPKFFPVAPQSEVRKVVNEVPKDRLAVFSIAPSVEDVSVPKLINRDTGTVLVLRIKNTKHKETLVPDLGSIRLFLAPSIAFGLGDHELCLEFSKVKCFDSLNSARSLHTITTNSLSGFLNRE